MGGGIVNLVASGPLILAVPVALAAGAVTFLSPCVLPLVPGYLSYVTGMSGTVVSDAGGGAAVGGACPHARPGPGCRRRGAVRAGLLRAVRQRGCASGRHRRAAPRARAGGEPDSRQRDHRARPDV